MRRIKSEIYQKLELNVYLAGAFGSIVVRLQILATLQRVMAHVVGRKFSLYEES